MINEYTYTITVEIDAKTNDEQKQLRKQFKADLFRQYGPNPITRITEIKRQ
jgi:hypothetical protein